MNVLLQFDYEDHLLHIPDGYISDIHRTHQEFYSWLYQQEKNMVESANGYLGCAYCADDFLEYVNTVVLKNSNERAYFIPHGHINKRLEF